MSKIIVYHISDKEFWEELIAYFPFTVILISDTTFLLFAPTLEHKVDFSVSLIIFTDGSIPWTADQLVARPLPKQRTTQTHTPNIHAFSGIRTHDPCFRVSEDSACIRSLGYRDRQCIRIIYQKSVRTSQEADSYPRSRLPSERRQCMP
jgi:hypothetical protein